MYWNIWPDKVLSSDSWLTLTWDVLKLATPNIFNNAHTINFNMGCIETQYMADSIDIQLRINFNMGCIETSFDV